MLELLRQIGVTGALDIALMAALVYALISLLERSRLQVAAVGALLLAAVYLLARLFELTLTASVLEAAFAVLVIGLIVVFRDELRRFLEQLGRVGRLGLRPRAGPDEERPAQELVAETLAGLAARRVGALLVLRRKHDLTEHLAQGVALDGELSGPLLESLFDPHSAGHDGAVVLEGGRVTRFACHLPLSSDASQLERLGTRHAAALGLAEVSDALCVVVSEERGTLRLARDGRLSAPLTAEALAQQLGKHATKDPQAMGTSSRRHVLKAVAVVVSAALWAVVVHGSRPTVESIRVPVLPASTAEKGGGEAFVVKPKQVTVTLTGPRRAFYFFGRQRLHVLVPVDRPRRQVLSIADVNVPSGVTVRAIHPSSVLVRRAPSASAPTKPTKASKASGSPR